MKRHKMSRKQSKRIFKNTAHAGHVRAINYKPIPMRGGFRI